MACKYLGIGPSLFRTVFLVALVPATLAGCADDDGGGMRVSANAEVRQRIADLAPLAVFAHRGLGPTRSGHPLPENSLSSFRAAIAAGADALEMDSELTADNQIVIMHDDTVDRTTECSGCVSALTLDQIRNCRLLDGDGQPTDQTPPTLDEVVELEPRDILINVELKVFDDECLTSRHGPADLATAMVATLRRLGAERRTVVQSFDVEALMSVKEQAPEIFTALLVSGLRIRDITTALELSADALQPGGPFPLVNLSPTLLQNAFDAGLQVIPWTVNDVASINQLLDDNVSGIITDDPALVQEVVRDRVMVADER